MQTVCRLEAGKERRRSCLDGRMRFVRRAYFWSPLLALSTFAVARNVAACPNCAASDEVWHQVNSHAPLVTAGTLTLAFVIVAGLIAVAARLAKRARRLVAAALLLGAGLGGFFDGIVFHQVLQWHAMISSRLAPVDLISSKVNMFWDGIFHLYCWVAVVAALALLLQALPKANDVPNTKVVWGGALAGWGLFNVVEGTINHQLMNFHHLHPGSNELAWDIGFLWSGLVLIALGGRVAFAAFRR